MVATEKPLAKIFKKIEKKDKSSATVIFSKSFLKIWTINNGYFAKIVAER
jgi:hypothetical protein